MSHDTLDSNQSAAFQHPVAKFAYLVEFTFLGGSPPAPEYVRLCTLGQTIHWNYDWLGAGSILSISGVEESASLSSSSLTFTLNVAQSSYLQTAVGDVESYRAQPAKMYICPVDKDFAIIGTPKICWEGLMDVITINIDGQQGSIELKCENSSYSLKRRNIKRMNAAQQHLSYPTDTGFDYLNDLIANPQKWLSKKFQGI